MPLAAVFRSCECCKIVKRKAGLVEEWTPNPGADRGRGYSGGDVVVRVRFHIKNHSLYHPPFLIFPSPRILGKGDLFCFVVSGPTCAMQASIEKRIRSVFQVPRKGESFELRSGLVSQYAYERKDAIQRTISAMTLGKDVSSLFPDVLKNIATPDLEQKKLVYLYLMNYAKTHPDLCILAVNTFVQDSADPNPLVRALAIRTMGCIRVDKIIDYMEEPLRKTLVDESPYVRKTAAICVAKLFDLNPTLVIENGFLKTLQAMLGDANPMVIANAVSSLTEIQEAAPETDALVVNPAVLKKLLNALNECTEWGRIAILAPIASYNTTDVREAEHICERVVPHLQHVNPSVVLAAIKAVLSHLHLLDPELRKQYLDKMSPPLVTLAVSQPEVQYVALRNINLILQKYPTLLNNQLRVFFCKYNDPLYLKVEKLDIMIRLANSSNVDTLLSELKEYAMEVDMDFVRRAVKAIGQCAIKIETSSQRCVSVLLDLIATKVDYIVQESVIVMRDILRKYPSYDGVIPTLCQGIDELDEPESRAAMIWIVGEFADKIDNADEILTTFIDGFKDETTQVQLQLLTATVKLFLLKPQTNQALVQRVLQLVANECDNADLRDRAYIYWRLLSSSPQTAKEVILSKKPPVKDVIQHLPGPVLEELLLEISTLASVYHRPAETFIGQGRFGADALTRKAIEEQAQLAQEEPTAATNLGNLGNLLDIDFDLEPVTPTTMPAIAGVAGLSLNGGAAAVMQTIGGVSAAPAAIAPVSTNQPAQFRSNVDDLLGMFD
ncbi:adaptin N terminal region-domain-containing protein [Limtongia smithiae]|uniref:adaptin N terminal region-domain-containing protein n=1 Tax=Limtongia smithiae TaxID=1125753 RepID=UPI0034CDF6F6